MKDIRIITYSEKYQSKHLEFAQKYWNKRVRQNPPYILWKFQLHNQEHNTFLLAIYHEQVIGQLGLVPVQIFHQGNLVKGFWFCDLMVDKEFRGKGVAKKLYNYAIKMNKGIFLGSDPSPAAKKSMIRYGFYQADCGWKYILPLNLNRVLAMKWKGFLTSIKLPNFLMNLFIWGTNPEKDLQKTQLEHLPDLFQPANESETSYQIKDKDFLKWRFQQRPLHGDTYYIYQDKSSQSALLYYIGGEDLLLAELNGHPTKMKEAIKLAYRIARKHKLRSVRLIHDEGIKKELPFYMACFMIRMRTPTKVLYYNKFKPGEKIAFKYTPLDSDENI